VCFTKSERGMTAVRIAWRKDGGNFVAVVMGVSREAMRGQRGCDVGASCKNYHEVLAKFQLKMFNVSSTYKKIVPECFSTTKDHQNISFFCHRKSTSIY
jgi:hypothetical protein